VILLTRYLSHYDPRRTALPFVSQLSQDRLTYAGTHILPCHTYPLRSAGHGLHFDRLRAYHAHARLVDPAYSGTQVALAQMGVR
jgi:hypothetical protein